MSSPKTAAQALLAVALLGCGCAHGGGGGGASGGASRDSRALEPDSVTSALWRMDEAVGLKVADAGPFRLEGTAGVDTRSDYGRIGRARSFTASINSFVFVPYNPVLEAGDAFTIEAWVDPSTYGQYEDTPIASRFSPEALQSAWLFSIVGKNQAYSTQPSPGEHVALIQGVAAGKLMFAFAPDDATPTRVYFSTRPIELDRWTHVAVTYDGRVVRLFIDGQLDAQYASPGKVRRTDAPLVIGNYFDPRYLTNFSGDLKMGPTADQYPYYAFVGLIDDLRISSAARTGFPYARP